MTDILHAKKLGYKIKLLSISEIKMNKLSERVHPCLISNTSHLSNIEGVLNAVVIDGLPVGTGYRGPITKALQEAFFGIFDGTTEVPESWLDPVE